MSRWKPLLDATIKFNNSQREIDDLVAHAIGAIEASSTSIDDTRWNEAPSPSEA